MEPERGKEYCITKKNSIEYSQCFGTALMLSTEHKVDILCGWQ
jgi:hypothetical protein